MTVEKHLDTEIDYRNLIDSRSYPVMSDVADQSEDETEETLMHINRNSDLLYPAARKS